MPLGIRDPEALVAEIHQRTMRLKNSAEPLVAFGMQRVIADAPATVARRLTDYFSGKTIGQLSNVPGPQAPADHGRRAGPLDARLGADLGRSADRHLSVHL